MYGVVDMDDDRYMDWADQERLVRQDVDRLNEMFRRQARHYREEEMKGDQHERADIRY